MQHDIQQWTVDLQMTIVINQTHISEPIHEKTYAGAGRADQLRERLLANLCDNRLGSTFLAKIRQ